MSKVESPLSEYPLVSVVIPVYNDADRLQKTLGALKGQTYPDSKYEVIVVDNGSTDESVEVASSFDRIALLFEHENLSSPYSARNRGIEEARGKIVALLDATCVPVEEWLQEAISCFEATEADLLGGNVEFSFRSKKPGAGELYDSLTNVQMKESVAQGKAKTGNLFIRREVIGHLGLFPEGLRSGGDVRWTRRATDRGYVLKFCQGAKVFYPARGLWRLIRKQWRVGKGKAEMSSNERRGVGIAKLFILGILPPGFDWLKEKAEKRGYLRNKWDVFRLWIARYIINFVMKTAQSRKLVEKEIRRVLVGKENGGQLL